MKDNEKYYTDQEFKQACIVYNFVLYSNKAAADKDTNAIDVMPWCNNELTRHEAHCVLFGISAAARIKYKHPVAVLYGIGMNGSRDKLASVQG